MTASAHVLVFRPLIRIMREREDEVARSIDEVLVRLPPPAPPPPRTLQAGEHDFSPQGLCRLCGAGSSTLLACPGTRRENNHGK